MNEDIVKTLYSQEEIKNVIARLGKEISADMKDKNPVVVCILTGAVIFMTDLVREMDIKCNLEFMDVSSYGTGTTSTGNVKIIKDLDTSVEGRNVLIVEDIIDTGKTLHRLVDLFKTRDAESVKIVTLLDKPARRTETVTPDYVGISDVPNEFVVGYGLDYQGYYRNLPYIGVLKPEIYTEN